MFEGFVQYLINNFSYLGVFVASIIVSSSIIFPLPGQLVIVLAVLLKLNPILTSILSGIGSMIGEMTGYGLGVVGGNAVRIQLGKHKKIVSTLRRYFSRYSFWVIFATAFLFFPFDLVGILCGMNRYNVKKFWLAGFMGKFLKTLMLFILIQKGFHYFGFIGM